MNASEAADQFLERGESQELAEGVRELLWGLRAKGYILGLVSNRREPLTGVALEYDILEFFDFTLAAGQVGHWKPHPAIFHTALAMAGNISPQKTLYIGDNYYTDILGAQGVGLHAALIDAQGAFSQLENNCLRLKQVGDISNWFE